LRFAHVATDEQIARYADQIDFVHDRSSVFDRRLRLVAIAHLAFAPDGLTAEFGVSVASRVRGRGFGTRLFDHAVMPETEVSIMILSWPARTNPCSASFVAPARKSALTARKPPHA
jgi:hypothetical protein